jgi:5,6-dimethylbenzimidazole synthase
MPEFTNDFCAQLLELFKWRRDVRQFRRDPLPTGTWERLTDIARLAPSVGLSEPWRFILVESENRRRAIRECFEDSNRSALRGYSGERAALYAKLKLEGLDDAPCQFAVFVDPMTTQGHGLGRLTMRATVEYSAVMAVSNLWLAARAEGIGMGWVSILDPQRVTAILEVTLHWKLIGYFCLGFPIEQSLIPALERAGWECRNEPTLIRR